MKPTRFIQNFLRCGITGWCLEILFTAMHSLQKREMALRGTTSLWMFPIYGMGAVIAPLSRILHRQSIWLRGLLYTFLIFSVEFISGSYLTKRNSCPWNYRRSSWNIREVIRLDYAPCWFLTGLLMERLTGSSYRKVSS